MVHEHAEGKHTVFANKIGILPTSFNNYLKGRIPNVKMLINIYETFKVNSTWILTAAHKTNKKLDRVIELLSRSK